MTTRGRTMTREEAFAQGARCGHIEGKDRTGSYIRGEEDELSWEAANNQSLNDIALTNHWASGYRYGYLLAAEGSELPAEYELKLD